MMPAFHSMCAWQTIPSMPRIVYHTHTASANHSHETGAPDLRLRGFACENESRGDDRNDDEQRTDGLARFERHTQRVARRVAQGDGHHSNEMHAPDGDQSERHTGTDEQQPVAKAPQACSLLHHLQRGGATETCDEIRSDDVLRFIGHVNVVALCRVSSDRRQGEKHAESGSERQMQHPTQSHAAHRMTGRSSCMRHGLKCRTRAQRLLRRRSAAACLQMPFHAPEWVRSVCAACLRLSTRCVLPLPWSDAACG